MRLQVFVDIDSGIFNLDVEPSKRVITDKTKAIMPVILLANR